MTRSDDYAQLARITDAAMHVAQSKMQSLLSEEASLLAQIEALQLSRSRPIQNGTPAQVGAADVKWQIWIDHRREELNMELARIYVKKDAARAQLKRAFGKDQTVQALLKKQSVNQILKQNRQVS